METCPKSEGGDRIIQPTSPRGSLPCEAPLLSISILNAKSVSVGGLRKGLGRFLSIGSIFIDELAGISALQDEMRKKEPKSKSPHPRSRRGNIRSPPMGQIPLHLPPIALSFSCLPPPNLALLYPQPLCLFARRPKPFYPWVS